MKRWEDNIREWTGMEFGKTQRTVENRDKWRKLVAVKGLMMMMMMMNKNRRIQQSRI